MPGAPAANNPSVNTPNQNYTVPQLMYITKLTPNKEVITTPDGKPFAFTTNMQVSPQATADAKKLQTVLNILGFTVSDTGPGSIGKEIERFGPLTRAALIRFQIANNIKPSVGFFGPVTRSRINLLIEAAVLGK